MSTPKLFIALDGLGGRKHNEIMDIATNLSKVSGPIAVKINLDGFFDEDSTLKDILSGLKKLGLPIFADLKMWNGKRTMTDVVRRLGHYGVDYINIYALADQELAAVVEKVEMLPIQILAVTVLTHYDESYCHCDRTHR